MITVNQASSASIEEIEEAIAERKVLIQNMVGTLYPSIIGSEISRLNSILWGKKAELAKEQQSNDSNNG